MTFSIALLFAILTLMSLLIPGFNPLLIQPSISLAFVFAVLTAIFIVLGR